MAFVLYSMDRSVFHSLSDVDLICVPEGLFSQAGPQTL